LQKLQWQKDIVVCKVLTKRSSSVGDKHEREEGSTGYTPLHKQGRGGEQPPEQRAAAGGKSQEERRNVHAKRTGGPNAGDVQMGSAE